MAYAFSNIRSALAGQDDDQSQTNIFQAPGQAPTDAAQVTPGQAQAKTSTEGQDQLGGSGGQTGAEATPQAPQPTTTARQAVSRNVGKTQNPALIQRAQQGLSAADTQAQTESDAYIKKAKDTSYGVNAQDIDSYVNEGKSENVSKLLGTGAVSADAYNSKVDLSLPDIDQLQSDYGIQQALRNEGGQDYNAGMGAFDLAALKRTQGFDQIRQQLATGKQALIDKETGFQKDNPLAAQAALEANLKTAKSGLTTGLQDRSKALTAADEKLAADANTAAGKAKAKMIADAAAKAKIAQMERSTSGAIDPRLAALMNAKSLGIDPSQYYQYDNNNWQDMVTPEQALQFQRIQEALTGGLGVTGLDPVMAGGGAHKATFDDKGFGSALTSGAQKKRLGMDTADRAQIARLQAAAKARYNPNYERTAEMGEVRDALSGDYGDIYDQVSLNSDDYGVASGWDQNYTGSEAKLLNSLYGDLGTKDRVAAGNGMGAFDKDSYRAALEQALQQKRLDIATAQAAAASGDEAAQAMEEAAQGGDSNDVQNIANMAHETDDAVGGGRAVTQAKSWGKHKKW